jgi:hypothetical protein
MPDARGSWDLAVTRRCRTEDLGLRADEDWREHLTRVSALAAFDERRSQRVGILPVPVFTLHSAEDRGATWYDDQEDIVWLLAVAPNHGYDYFPHLAQRGQLLPTEDDYLELEADLPDRFELERIGRHAREIRTEATARPGEVVDGVLGNRVLIRVCVEVGEPHLLTVALSQRVIPGNGRMPPEWRYIVAQAFFPRTEFPGGFVPFAIDIDRTFVRDDELGLRGFLVDSM